MSYGGRIAILPGQAPAEEFSTLVHELAHEMLHKAERRIATTKTVRETEALVVTQTIASMPCASLPITCTFARATPPCSPLEVIQKTYTAILAATREWQKSVIETMLMCRTGLKD